MKILRFIILLSFCLMLFVSCEEYLDKAPESGLTEEEVFTKYQNFIKFFDAVYDGNSGSNITAASSFKWNFLGNRYNEEVLTDHADFSGSGAQISMKQGIFAQYAGNYIKGTLPFLEGMYKIIRISNITIRNVDRLNDGTQEDIDDMLAQAYFVRAYAHFCIMRFYGSVPYIEKPLGPDDEWDIARPAPYDMLIRAAADLDTAAIYFEKAKRMRRDNPVVGGAGHLNHPDIFRPNGVAAIALKARILLYAASPLNNKNGVSDWEDAAIANWEAIKVAQQYGYALMNAANYSRNYWGVQYSNEHLWAYNYGTRTYSNWSEAINGVFRNAKGAKSGACPTQNFVDKFETLNGDPLNTEADRTAAETAGNYMEQNPYNNRDPRLGINVIHNQASIPGTWKDGKAQLYYEVVGGAIKYSELLDPTYSSGVTRTYYYHRKHWAGQSVKNRTTVTHTDPLIRLGELYLNYAEAANEAYGPGTAAPGAAMTSVQALNVIRNRINMPDIQSRFTNGKDVLRSRIKNERDVELAFEGHHYHDIRRWKDAPDAMKQTYYGVTIEKVAVSPEFPIGYKHTRMPLPAICQTKWKDAMYYFTFTTNDNYLYKNFVPNELW